MPNENIKTAVDILDEAQGYALEALKNEPMLSLRVSNTMTTLINGLNHIGGFVGSSAKETLPTIQPAKSFMGLDLEELDKQEAPAKVVVELDEKEKAKVDVEKLYAVFSTKDDNEIKDTVSQMYILGVAKMAGLVFENPSSVKITLKLIREIKDAIKAKAELEIQQNLAKDNLNVGGLKEDPEHQGNNDAPIVENENAQTQDSAKELDEKEK